VLLKGGLDNEVGRFLLGYQTGESAGGTSLLNVIALRKDGTEFPARVTTQTWSWDKNVAKKGDTSARNWTAIFRDLSEAPAPANPPAPAPPPEVEVEVATAPVESPVAIPMPSAEKPSDPPVERSPAVAPKIAPPVAPQAEPAIAKKEGWKPEPPKAGSQKIGSKKSDTAHQFPSPPAVKDLEGVAVELSRRFEEQFATLRQEREELKRRVHDLEGQPSKAPANPDPSKREAEKPGLAQAELRTQLEAAKEAAGVAEAKLNEEVERREKLEQQLKTAGSSRSPQSGQSPQGPEVDTLRKEREELKRNLKLQEQAAAEATRRAGELENRFSEAVTEYERVKSELTGLTVARDRTQAEWRQQLADAQAVKASLEMSLGEALARHNNNEAEVVRLRRENQELTSKLADEQLAAAQTQHLTGGAKGRPGRNAPDASRASAESAQWRAQLEAANTVKTRLEASLVEAQEHRKRFEQEVAKLRQERDDVRAKLVAELEATAHVQKLTAQDKTQSGPNAAESKRAAAELEKLNAERKQAEAQWREQLDATKLVKERLEATLREALERQKSFEQEVSKLKHERDDLQARLTAEQQVVAQLKRRVEEFEAQSRKLTGELGHAKAEAEKRERAHAELRTQFDAAKEAAGFNDAALKEEVARRQKLEAQLQTLESRLKQTQTEHEERFDEELRDLRQEREQLSTKLEAQQKLVAEATRRADELASRVSQDAAESERARTELEVKTSERERERED